MLHSIFHGQAALLLGVASVLVWAATGDLRIYAWVQFTAFATIPLALALFRSRFSRDATRHAMERANGHRGIGVLKRPHNAWSASRDDALVALLTFGSTIAFAPNIQIGIFVGNTQVASAFTRLTTDYAAESMAITGR